MLVVICFFAASLTFLPVLRSSYSSIASEAAIVLLGGILVLVYLAGCICFHLSNQIVPRPLLTFTGWILLTMSIAFCCYTIWARHRFRFFLDDPQYPRAFPNPDELVVVFANWLAQRNPDRYDSELTIDAGIWDTFGHLTYLIYAGVVIATFMLGLVAPGIMTCLRNVAQAHPLGTSSRGGNTTQIASRLGAHKFSLH